LIDAEALIEVAVVEYVNRLEEELAALKSAALEYSYNMHSSDCKITRYTNPVCNCGLVELEALLEAK
jgi:hypothetical protein